MKSIRICNYFGDKIKSRLQLGWANFNSAATNSSFIAEFYRCEIISYLNEKVYYFITKKQICMHLKLGMLKPISESFTLSINPEDIAYSD